MIKVECDGCGSPYQIDEKRVPEAGLKMRCPKCGKNLLVSRPTQSEPDLPAIAPAPARPPLPRPGGAKPPPPPVTEAKKGGGGGFGEIDLGVDLPAPGPSGPVGAPPRRAPAPVAPVAFAGPVGSAASSPPISMGELDLPGPFGEIDLPEALEADDLPSVPPKKGPPPVPPRAPPQKSHPAFGEVDLPAPAFPASDLPSPAFGPPGLPMPASRGGGFGEIDLPSAAPHAPPFGTPASGGPGASGGPPRRVPNRTVNFGDIDLPSAPSSDAHGHDAPSLPVAANMRPRNKTVNFGDIDLPTLPDDLPAAPRGFGEIDLPRVSDASGLPAALEAGFPSPVGAGLPSPAGAGLPSALGAGLPSPVGAGLPSPIGAGLPVAQAGLPMAQSAGFPMAQGAGLPTSASTGLPMTHPSQGAGFPMSTEGHGLPMTHDPGLPAALGGRGDSGFPDSLPSNVNVFDDSDRAVPAAFDPNADSASVGVELDSSAVPTRAAVGSEVDLGASGGATDLADVAPLQRRERDVAPVKRSKAGRIGVLVGVLAAITGGALTLVPSVGPFGAYFILDRVNAKKHEAALVELRGKVTALLDQDTFAADSEASDRCRADRATMPRYQKATAYCALVATTRGVRFGRRTEDDALARQLLGDASDDGGDASIATNAALDLLAGQPAKARPAIAGVAKRNPDDVDYAALAGAVELADKAGTKEAVTAWSNAVALHKSPRTLFGLARAGLANEDTAMAETNAKATLAASPAHAGARIMLATLMSADPAREADALALLKEVTTKGPASESASDGEKVAAYAQTGMIDLGRSRMSSAEQAFAAALKINPLAVTALVGNGELFYRSGRYSEAVARFEAASNADPDGILPKVGIAKTFIALERMREAKDLLKKLREANPQDPVVALWLGRSEEVLGNKKEAEAGYIEAIKEGGSRLSAVDAYVALVRLLSSIGRTEEANAKLAEAAKQFPDLPALHRARGELAIQLGRYDEARTELEAALAKSEDLGARFFLGVALRRLRRYDEASATFDKVAAGDPDYPGLALERGVISQETGQADRALELYRKALEKAPNDIDLKLRVGQTQVMAGHPIEAEKILDEVRRARPNSAEANHYLGRVLLAKGENLAEASRYLELAAQIDGNRPEYHLYVGWVANEQGQAAKAGASLNKALELDHDLGDAYWQRGVLLQKQGATTDALRDLRTALEKNPSRLEAWATIALCDQDLQRWDEAEKAWRAAIGGNHDVAEWHYRLGKLLRDHGNRAGVGPEMETAVTLAEKPNQPHNAWLLDAHFLLAEAVRGSDRAKAIEHYQRFLALAPSGNPYRKEAEDALRGLGAPPSQ